MKIRIDKNLWTQELNDKYNLIIEGEHIVSGIDFFNIEVPEDMENNINFEEFVTDMTSMSHAPSIAMKSTPKYAISFYLVPLSFTDAAKQIKSGS